MRVLLADCDSSVRSALRLLLTQLYSAEADIREVPDTKGVRKVCGELPAIDLALIDWNLLGTRAEHTLRDLHGLQPGMAIVVLSGRPETRHAALRAGAQAFVSKGDPPELLRNALRNTLRLLPAA